MDPEDIRNWLRLSDRITTSGRLQPGDPERLAAAGARRVINLALASHPEALPEAEVAIRRAANIETLGLRELPRVEIGSRKKRQYQITRTQATAFKLNLLRDYTRHVVHHCAEPQSFFDRT